jgi:hypothetical protein
MLQSSLQTSYRQSMAHMNDDDRFRGTRGPIGLRQQEHHIPAYHQQSSTGSPAHHSRGINPNHSAGDEEDDDRMLRASMRRGPSIVFASAVDHVPFVRRCFSSVVGCAGHRGSVDGATSGRRNSLGGGDPLSHRRGSISTDKSRGGARSFFEEVRFFFSRLAC